MVMPVVYFFGDVGDIIFIIFRKYKLPKAIIVLVFKRLNDEIKEKSLIN